MRILLASLLGFFSVGVTNAAEPVDYVRDIKPILHARCSSCHGALKQKAGLRLDAAQLIRKGGKNGPVIVPGNSAGSLLIEKVTGDERSRMPPKSEGSPLSAKQIALLKSWIDQGAKAADELIPEDPRKHWAYQVPIRPAVPVVKNPAWVRNPIDAFIAAEHEKRGLKPCPPAAKEVLLRRVYLDLIGLPPTRDELTVFLADTSPDAYEKIVDKLLASSRYGERWGRHWMDVWRYSDWYGSRSLNELRNSRRHIWRWRDWIIESLNHDKGYDRMIVEMLAGDELAPGDQDVQRAMGYLGRNFYVFNRTVWLQDTVEYVGTSFLGITLKCCRCHDHKYDPVTQEDYYRLRAFFEPHNVRVDPLPSRRQSLQTHLAMGSPPGSELKDGLDCVYDADLTSATFLFDRGDEKHPVKDRPLTPGVPKIVEKDPVEIRAVALPVEAFYPDLRPFRQREMIEAAQAEIDKAKTALNQTKDPVARALTEKVLATTQATFAALQARLVAEKAKFAIPPDPRAQGLALAAGRAEGEAALRKAIEDQLRLEQQLATGAQPSGPRYGKSPPTKTALEQQLAAAKQRVQAARAALAKPTPKYTPLGPVYPSTSTGRRLALARWIASKDNPLTARVAVNHIWLRHFGSALVPTVSNFGLNGKSPTHPELFDWLAAEFMDAGWTMKHLHRLIVTSNAYRMQSSSADRDDPNRRIDPENQYLLRMNPRRMEAEVVRDSLLHLSGRLDLTMCGPELDPETADTTRRRSVYFRHTPDSLPTMLSLFDSADTAECFRRMESIVPQQALALSNSNLSFAEARVLADNLSKQIGRESNTDSGFVKVAFEQTLARAPTEPEQKKCEEFLWRQAELFRDPKKLTRFAGGAGLEPRSSGDPHQRARESLVHVLLNHNDFVMIR